jgi:hypothetical protein
MPYLFIILLLALVRCGGGGITPPPDKTPVIVWKAGVCQDKFILQQRLGDGWIPVGETAVPMIKVPLDKGEEAEFTVAGVCKDGEHKGEWQSQETVTVKR